MGTYRCQGGNYDIKTKLQKSYYCLGFALTTALFPFAIWWYHNYDLGILIVASLYYLLFTLPSLYLHVEYAIRNAGEEMIINPDEIIVKKNGKERTYNVADLKEVILHKSASLDKWGMPFYCNGILSLCPDYYQIR